MSKRLRVVDTEDGQGLPTRVIVPEEARAGEGVPIELPLDMIYGHLPVEFRKRLYTALWEQGLIEAKDFLQPGADQAYKRAIMSIIKIDWLKIKQLAQETISHD